MNYTLKVAEIRKETEDTVTLCFKQPGLKKIKYLAGQYLTLIFRINGRRYIRPYSFSSCPSVDSYLEVTIKRVESGLVSNHINDMINVGDVIEAMPPMGDFIFESQEHLTDVYFWGVGSGITPLMSIIKHILTSTTDVRVHLSYGNKNNEATIFRKQILELEKKYSRRLIIRHFHTKLIVDESNPSVIQGRIDENKALSILDGQLAPENCAHYICGPAGLKESVKNAIQSKYGNLVNVFSEDFELIKDPKDFEDIHTQKISLVFEGTKHALEIVKGKSILEAALNADIELPYSCQTGNCSTCKGKLIAGSAKMIGLSKQREDLEIDEFLLCCTHPLTDNVHIEI
ncbi:ring-1,2-phenylacetyl-CoA epoxidase subunit PaaE [Pedobacter psychrotolerans]|uniref:Phenylacetic acid degradation protein n=1 Tax=Pedobacter psychrotolerans TaxID=1843235 RepID=A0A4R2HEA8_9SPHI|nr:ferredoxin--NADP reductase [Pedobacter psychrotolerans]TCO26692.1 ring-1,2-phenylacetyl-CoA epoxidase subunit PaaE [Pedobacter psychrotolerans]GGE55775.1 phenylacetic acid degradation protein [Pedobacter psychrotolerans]